MGIRRHIIWTVVRALALTAWAPQLFAQTHSVSLEEGWRFRALASPDHSDAEHWMPAVVPGVVQTDLVRAGLIPEPFFADNEKSLQWIGTTDWEYKKDFRASPQTLQRAHAELVFDGLDTLADVWLNDAKILHAENMFRSWHVDVTGHLRAQNTLRLVFRSPINAVAAAAPKLPYIVPGTGYEPLDRSKGVYPTSQFVRKAAYSFGWDWAPRLVTAGIWRPVHLDTWNEARIRTIHLHQESVTAERAVTQVELNVDSSRRASGLLIVSVLSPTGRSIPPIRLPVTLDSGENHFIIPLRIEHPQRWYPNGYGPQALYTIKAELAMAQGARDSRTLRTGLRSLELRRLPDSFGRSFTFVVNDIPLFAKGANFVPLDSFPPAVTPDRRLRILTAARDANMNMLRIWGGGYYESDDFYEDADRLGLLIWHDFMFGGSMIPHDPEYFENVRAEAIEQVERLSDHPSLALWCGNNEVETAWKGWDDHQKFKAGLTPDQREQVWQDYLLIFHDILQSAVAKHGNGVPYWPSSPSKDPEEVDGAIRSGDEHSWRVWSGGAPFSEYAASTPRFLSEFGFQAMPDLGTVRSFAGNEEDLTSPALLDHERFLRGFSRMQQYLAQEFQKRRDFSAVDYLSQVMQAEAIKFAVETMRLRRPQNMGTLFWQLDDCWPVISWSSMDYLLRPKALEFYARRFYSPLLIVATNEGTSVRLSVVSDELRPRLATLHWRLLKFDGTILREGATSVQINALASTDAGNIDLKDTAGFDPDDDVLTVSLDDARPAHLATQVLFFAPSKNLRLPREQISASVESAPQSGRSYIVVLSARQFARAVQVTFADLDVQPDDNFFDLLPGETRSIGIRSSASLTQLRSSLKVIGVEGATR